MRWLSGPTHACRDEGPQELSGGSREVLRHDAKRVLSEISLFFHGFLMAFSYGLHFSNGFLIDFLIVS